MSAALGRYARDPIAFIDRFIRRNEKGQPWTLSRHQRRVLALALRWGPAGVLLLRLLLWSEVKKSGKTFLAACLTIWWAYTRPYTEVIVAANDLDQSVGRVFRTIVALLQFNPELAKSATPRATEIALSNGTTILAIPSDYKGAAGSRHSLVVFEELWGYTQESAQRLYEELTPPPTEPDAWVLIMSTAGWIGESALLEGLYKRGLAGQRIDQELEVYAADELCMFWSHEPRQPWLTEAYYAEQRRILRPGTFQRLHCNEWVSSESVFITPELWDPCVDPNLTPLLPSKQRALFSGVDGAYKHDFLAEVRVFREGNTIVLAGHRIWRPTPGHPLDLEATIERHLLDLRNRYLVQAIRYDPHQLHRSMTTLGAAGLPVQEFAQTVEGTTRMGQILFDLLTGRNLRMYPSEELRQQALNCVAVETARGFRLAKERASRKIDGIVALAMACVAATEAPVWTGSAWGAGSPPAPVDERLLQQAKNARLDAWAAGAEARAKRWARDRGYDL